MVQHRMAVGADRPQVAHRIHTIRAVDFAEWLEMVNVNESLAHRTVHLAEIDFADRATGAVVLHAFISSCTISLVGVHPNRP